ncbi:MAG TPA: hypothetical protein VKM56_14780 [Verrucomicrobiae bacterium]|nr:hypothetical protein [Verrucomicrobiae bacterium]
MEWTQISHRGFNALNIFLAKSAADVETESGHRRAMKDDTDSPITTKSSPVALSRA